MRRATTQARGYTGAHLSPGMAIPELDVFVWEGRALGLFGGSFLGGAARAGFAVGAGEDLTFTRAFVTTTHMELQEKE